MKKIVMFGLVLFATMLQQGYAQCAMCKMSAEAATETMDPSIGERLNDGIIYLMVLPYIIFFIFFRKKIFKLFRELKNAARH